MFMLRRGWSILNPLRVNGIMIPFVLNGFLSPAQHTLYKLLSGLSLGHVVMFPVLCREEGVWKTMKFTEQGFINHVKTVGLGQPFNSAHIISGPKAGKSRITAAFLVNHLERMVSVPGHHAVAIVTNSRKAASRYLVEFDLATRCSSLRPAHIYQEGRTFQSLEDAKTPMAQNKVRVASLRVTTHCICPPSEPVEVFVVDDDVTKNRFNKVVLPALSPDSIVLYTGSRLKAPALPGPVLQLKLAPWMLRDDARYADHVRRLSDTSLRKMSP